MGSNDWRRIFLYPYWLLTVVWMVFVCIVGFEAGYFLYSLFSRG